jgi:hypothetical protein
VGTSPVAPVIPFDDTPSSIAAPAMPTPPVSYASYEMPRELAKSIHSFLLFTEVMILSRVNKAHNTSVNRNLPIETEKRRRLDAIKSATSMSATAVAVNSMCYGIKRNGENGVSICPDIDFYRMRGKIESVQRSLAIDKKGRLLEKSCFSTIDKISWGLVKVPDGFPKVVAACGSDRSCSKMVLSCDGTLWEKFEGANAPNFGWRDTCIARYLPTINGIAVSASEERLVLSEGRVYRCGRIGSTNCTPVPIDQWGSNIDYFAVDDGCVAFLQRGQVRLYGEDFMGGHGGSGGASLRAPFLLDFPLRIEQISLFVDSSASKGSVIKRAIVAGVTADGRVYRQQAYLDGTKSPLEVANIAEKAIRIAQARNYTDFITVTGCFFFWEIHEDPVLLGGRKFFDYKEVIRAKKHNAEQELGISQISAAESDFSSSESESEPSESDDWPNDRQFSASRKARSSILRSGTPPQSDPSSRASSVASLDDSKGEQGPGIWQSGLPSWRLPSPTGPMPRVPQASSISRYQSQTGVLSHGQPLAKAAVTWVDDNEHDECQRCPRKFTQWYRRHHCRACGLLVCGECSKYKKELFMRSGERKSCRVCFTCKGVPPTHF